MVDTHTHLKRATYLSQLMDNKFGIGPFRFGLDPLTGLIPVVGDTLPLLLSGYMIWIGYHLGLDTYSLGKMVVYTVLDVLIGSVPFVGDLADFAFKSHIKNLKVLQEYHSAKVG